MLRNVCHFLTAALMTVIASTSFANNCVDYFKQDRFDALFKNQTFTIDYLVERTSITMERTPVQIYMLEFEGSTILKGLRKQGPKYLQKFKGLIESHGILSSTEAQLRPVALLENRIHDINASIRNTMGRSDLMNFNSKQSAEARSEYIEDAQSLSSDIKIVQAEIQTLLRNAQDLAYKLKSIESEAQNLPLKTVDAYTQVRIANLRLIKELEQLLKFIPLLTNDSERLLRPEHQGEGMPEHGARSVVRAGVAQSATPTPSTQNRRDRYSQSYVPSYGTLPQAELRQNPRDRLARSFEITNYHIFSDDALQKTKIRERYDVVLNSSPSRIPNQQPYIAVLREMRAWITSQKLRGKITVSHDGQVKTPIRVTIYSNANENVFEKFQEKFQSLIREVTRATKPEIVREKIPQLILDPNAELRDVGEGSFAH